MLEYILLSRANAERKGEEVPPVKDAPALPGDTMENLRTRVGSLELAVETMGRLLVQSGVIKEEEFFELAYQIDAEDGVIDGRRDLTKLRKKCPTCSRINGADKRKCLWCGADIAMVEPSVD